MSYDISLFEKNSGNTNNLADFIKTVNYTCDFFSYIRGNKCQ